MADAEHDDTFIEALEAMGERMRARSAERSSRNRLPAPVDGPDYTRLMDEVQLAWRLDVSVGALTAATLLATCEARGRIIDGLSQAYGLDDIIISDYGAL